MSSSSLLEVCTNAVLTHPGVHALYVPPLGALAAGRPFGPAEGVSIQSAHTLCVRVTAKYGHDLQVLCRELRETLEPLFRGPINIEISDIS